MTGAVTEVASGEAADDADRKSAERSVVLRDGNSPVQAKVPIKSMSTAASSAPRSRKAMKQTLTFLKEWAGIGTLLVALLYTFPFDLYERYWNWDRRSLLDARAAVADMADLAAQRISATAQIRDDVAARDLLSNMYNIRIFNIIMSNIDGFKEAGPRLTFSELYAIGSNLTMNGLVPDALYFYELSLKKADNKSVGTVNRELGWTLGQKGPHQDVPGARTAYLKAIAVVSEKINWIDPRFYAHYVFELAIVERHSGDWKCGEELIALADANFSAVAAYDPSILQLQNFFHRTADATKMTKGQRSDGCSYQVPANQVLFGP